MDGGTVEYRHSNANIGAASELVAAADLIAKGYEVFRAQTPNASCDLIALKNGICERVEVRTGRMRSDGTVTCGFDGGDHGRSDLLAVVLKAERMVYYVRSATIGAGPVLIDPQAALRATAAATPLPGRALAEVTPTPRRVQCAKVEDVQPPPAIASASTPRRLQFVEVVATSRADDPATVALLESLMRDRFAVAERETMATLTPPPPPTAPPRWRIALAGLFVALALMGLTYVVPPPSPQMVKLFAQHPASISAPATPR